MIKRKKEEIRGTIKRKIIDNGILEIRNKVNDTKKEIMCGWI
jgi:hypothetical protein